jgi:hypothetical protein
VLLELVGRIEPLLAERTGEGARLKVALAMLAHEVGLNEPLAACEALEGFVLHVAGGHMADKLVYLLEGAVADFTQHLAAHVVGEHLRPNRGIKWGYRDSKGQSREISFIFLA